MELHEFGVAEPRAGVHRETEGVAGVLVAAGRGAAPDAVVSARGEDHGVRVDEVAGAVGLVEAVGAEHDVVAHEQARDVDVVEDRDLELLGLAHEGALDLEARVVAGERGAAEGVGAEEALRDAAVVFAGEVHAPALEVADATLGTLRHDLDGVRVGEQVALLDGVGCVLLPTVVGIHRAECRVDAAGGERRVRILPRSFPHGEHVHAVFGDLDRRPQTRPSSADDEDRGGYLSFARSHAIHAS